MLRVLITRSLPDALQTADAVAALGCHAIVQPHLVAHAIETPAPEKLAACTALLCTSKTAARYIPACVDRELPCLAVGDGTAETLTEMGFSTVETGSGGGAGLIDRLNRYPGLILHPCGTHVSDGTALVRAALADRLVDWPLYRMDAITDPALPCDVVLFHSGRAAETYLKNTDAATYRHTVALCLGASSLDLTKAHAFAKVAMAKTPDETALLALLQEMIA